MAEASKRQHEALRVPQGWEGQAKALIMQLERILTQLYQITEKTDNDLKEANSEISSLSALVAPEDITSSLTWIEGATSTTTNTKLYKIGSLRYLTLSCLVLTPAFSARTSKALAYVKQADYPEVPAFGCMTGYTTTGQVAADFRLNVNASNGYINVTSENAYSGSIYIRGTLIWVVK